jgi:8-oxo-dGTP pyrophosphatase MutT (NUDIX family)
MRLSGFHHMLEESSAGVVVYHLEDGEARYLVLKSERGRYDLPKGNIEAGETALSAAEREAREETGLRQIHLLPGFHETVTYFYIRPGGGKVRKTVHYFLGESRDTDVKVSEEHGGYSWLPFEQAVEAVGYPNLKELLFKAERFRRERRAQRSLDAY